MEKIIRDYQERALAFESKAQDIFSTLETSEYRIRSLTDSKKHLECLSVKQEELLNEALSCVKFKIYRSAHVMAWAAFMDFLEMKMASDGLVKLKSIKPDLSKYKSIEEIREKISEWEIINLAKQIGLISSSEAHIFHGDLTVRNKCAHPSDYKVNANKALGYINGIIDWIERLNDRKLN